MPVSAPPLPRAPVIAYEFPFNEAMRAWLRLEHLFDRVALLAARDDATDHHFALVSMFETLDVAGRSDLRGELIQEMERHRRQLAALRGNPAVAAPVLEQALADLDETCGALGQAQGKLGQALVGNEWLAGLRSRLAIPGGTCSFDLPGYHAWQHAPAERRRADLAAWVDTLRPWSRAIALVLGLVRGSGQVQSVVAEGGRYQQSLQSARPSQLARVLLPGAGPWVPEISGNRLLLVVRMLHDDGSGRLEPRSEPVPFQLALCH
jgi:cell division protein ZapD